MEDILEIIQLYMLADEDTRSAFREFLESRVEIVVRCAEDKEAV